jgi:hypothetical protein
MVQREIEVQADSTLREPALTFRSLGASGVIDGEDRMQPTLLPNSLEGYVARRTRFGCSRFSSTSWTLRPWVCRDGAGPVERALSRTRGAVDSVLRLEAAGADDGARIGHARAIGDDVLASVQTATRERHDPRVPHMAATNGAPANRHRRRDRAFRACRTGCLGSSRSARRSARAQAPGETSGHRR